MAFSNLASLPIEQKIGQLIFVGIPSPEIDPATVRLLEDINPGGVCLFARNIKEAAQTRDLLDTIREIVPTAPLLSLDQEGGLVDRLRRVIGPMPAANLLRNPEDAARLGRLIAEAVRIIGFNMDFAPVVDVIDAGRARFSNGLFSRAFGNSKEDAAELAGSFFRALESSGCLGCIKHFPGLGASEVDSHDELPLVNVLPGEFSEVDIYPYRRFFDSEEVSAVMVAHAAYPKLDLQETDRNGKLLPSSLSFNFISNLLRGELGYKGLVLTDDLEMGAIVKNYGIGEACRLAISAGEDMLTICAGVDAIYEGFEAVSNAVAEGSISESRIDESLARIAAVKSQMSEPLPFDSGRLQEIASEISEFNKELTQTQGG